MPSARQKIRRGNFVIKRCCQMSATPSIVSSPVRACARQFVPSFPLSFSIFFLYSHFILHPSPPSSRCNRQAARVCACVKCFHLQIATSSTPSRWDRFLDGWTSRLVYLPKNSLSRVASHCPWTIFCSTARCWRSRAAPSSLRPRFCCRPLHWHAPHICSQVVRAFGTSAEVVVRIYRDPSLQPFQLSNQAPSVCFASAFFVFVCRKVVNDAGQEFRPPFPQMFPETQWEMNE